MTMSHEPDQPPRNDAVESKEETRAAMELDRRVEALLDELVASAPVPDLPREFTASVLARRPFAPWEVRRARVWRLPAAVGLGLVGSSAAVFLAPVWSLGPATALELWAKLTAAALASPLEAALAAGPLLGEAIGTLSARTGGSALALLAAGVVLTGGALALGLRIPARQGAGRAASR